MLRESRSLSMVLLSTVAGILIASCTALFFWKRRERKNGQTETQNVVSPEPEPLDQLTWLTKYSERICPIPEVLQPAYDRAEERQVVNVIRVVDRNESREPFYPDTVERIFYVHQLVHDPSNKVIGDRYIYWRASTIFKEAHPFMVIESEGPKTPSILLTGGEVRVVSRVQQIYGSRLIIVLVRLNISDLGHFQMHPNIVVTSTTGQRIKKVYPLYIPWESVIGQSPYRFSVFWFFMYKGSCFLYMACKVQWRREFYNRFFTVLKFDISDGHAECSLICRKQVFLIESFYGTVSNTEIT